MDLHHDLVRSGHRRGHVGHAKVLDRTERFAEKGFHRAVSLGEGAFRFSPRSDTLRDMGDVFDTVPAIEHRGEAGSFGVWFPRPKVAVTRIEGPFSVDVAERFIEALEPAIEKGGFTGLHDWTGANGFDVSVPPRLGAWTLARLPKIARVVIATEHPFVGMAVRATNLTLKRIEHVESRAAFLEMMRAALR